MAKNTFENFETLILNTGNILSINDITKKPNQNTTEELVEAINFAVKDCQTNHALQGQSDNVIISRYNDDLLNKIQEHDLSDLKIGLKIFLNGDDQNFSIQAIRKAFNILQVNVINDVIITFKQEQSEDKKDNLDQIQAVWKILENFVHEEKIKQIGVADVEENTFRALYDWAEVKPSIIQINLATCCVVPPSLQTFCKEKDLKLLTHSDPTDILPEQNIESIFGIPFTLNWALRFLIHVKCRGVLITKGYLLNLSKS